MARPIRGCKIPAKNRLNIAAKETRPNCFISYLKVKLRLTCSLEPQFCKDSPLTGK